VASGDAPGPRWSPDEFVARLRAQGTRYHNLHPFHVRMDAGELSREELQRWVANRFYYQRCIPLKDAAILANCPDVEVRREWITRIIDHDGTAPGSGGIESWLRVGGGPRFRAQPALRPPTSPSFNLKKRPGGARPACSEVRSMRSTASCTSWMAR